MMLQPGETLDNRTLCDFFGVANTGGIRVNNGRSLIVLISNAEAIYKNEWQDGVLHFVGLGSVGHQMMTRQNLTLANARSRGYTIHLFEVFETGYYVYSGEVELVEPAYLSEQPDTRGHTRSVWIFPLQRKAPTSGPPVPTAEQVPDYLPHGTYALIHSELTEGQRAMVNEALDKLREAGVVVYDQGDVDCRRYQRALARWHETVLVRVRQCIKELIASKNRIPKASGRKPRLVDDELKISSVSSETELRAALTVLGYDDPVVQEQLFEDARRIIPMPDPPKAASEATQPALERPVTRTAFDRSRLVDFT